MKLRAPERSVSEKRDKDQKNRMFFETLSLKESGVCPVRAGKMFIAFVMNILCAIIYLF